ncbi:B3 domain-containing protein At3g18960-like [Lycium ferocissimum]|uniref:B3 domain-containing protein At3g18960-like n=1 Tax=Lycium ferocissimum TaxID=112874 RepID=UPI002814EAD0|nr:B3 domain-containing protein At3g18960-like [Lycium ferocissimum]
MEMKRKRGRPRKKPLVNSEKEEKLTCSSSHRRQPEFFTLFHSDWSSRQLKLPKNFTREFGESIKETSTIKDLTGKAWLVSVEKTEDGVFFIGEGWEDFINYHSLKDGYFLIFIYDEGDSSFTVKIFSTTACKKSVPMAIVQIKRRDHLRYKY